jgi:hypothetical protein
MKREKTIKPQKQEGEYRGCKITVTRELSCAGYEMLFFSVFDNGYEVTSGYSEGEDLIEDFYEDMKNLVDDYREHPEDYQECPEDYE